MILEIINQYLTVKINSKGAELWSIQDNEKSEYLWQGEQYWSDRAINLFPYIGRFTDGKYSLNGKEYHMDIHGFAKDSEFKVIEHSKYVLMLRLKDSPTTYGQYPYHFTFDVKYELDNNMIRITYIVNNCDEKKMYFAVGGHPGFYAPIEKQLDFTDYYLEFDASEEVKRIRFSDDCFVTEGTDNLPLLDGNKIPMGHDMFDNDAIVITNMPRSITLKSDIAKKSVQVTYPDMDYLGIWHWPKVEVPYVCIEPWSSLPSRKNIVEALEEKSDLISLETGEEYRNHWMIQINGGK